MSFTTKVRKKTGDWLVCEKTPKPLGQRRYFVCQEKNKNEAYLWLNFSKYSKAVKWAKEQRKLNDQPRTS